jgi:hypothetical protein
MCDESLAHEVRLCAMSWRSALLRSSSLLSVSACVLALLSGVVRQSSTLLQKSCQF